MYNINTMGMICSRQPCLSSDLSSNVTHTHTHTTHRHTHTALKSIKSSQLLDLAAFEVNKNDSSFEFAIEEHDLTTWLMYSYPTPFTQSRAYHCHEQNGAN